MQRLSWQNIGCAIGALALAGACAATPPPVEEPVSEPAVVIVASPVPTPTASVAIAAVPAPEPAVPDSVWAWEGVWQDQTRNGRVRITVRVLGSRPVVTDVVESEGDLERFEVRSSKWDSGLLTWREYVPSTTYLIEYRCTEVEHNEMICSWSNDHGYSGSANLQRVDDR